MAAAVARGRRGVLAKPMECDERGANARMPCERVPSMLPVQRIVPARPPASGARTRVQRQFPQLTRGTGAQQAVRTRATVTLLTIDMDDGLAPAIVPQMAGHTRGPRWTHDARGLHQHPVVTNNSSALKRLDFCALQVHAGQ